MSTTSVPQTTTQRKTQFVVVDYLDAFSTALSLQDKSTATVRAYQIGVADFREWFERTSGQAFTPALITALDVKAWRAHLTDARRLAAATVNNYLAGVRAFCGWAVEAGEAEHNPAAGIKGLKQVPEAPKWLTKQAQYKLLRTCEQQVQLGDVRTGGDMTQPGAIWPRRDRAIVVLLLNAGLRLAEAAALRLDDLEIKPRSGKVTVRRGKGRKKRTVRLNADARKALQDWLDVRPQATSEAVFLSQKGGRLRARSISGRVTALGDLAGLEHLTPHMLRHSLAKNMVDAGVPLDRVAKALGHSNLDTTKRYTTPSEQDMQNEMEKVSWQG